MKTSFPSFKEEQKAVNKADLFKEAASRAARTLAIRRRITAASGRRKWTGVVFDGQRSWVGQPVVLPDGSVGWIKIAQAGYVCVRTAVVDPEDGPVHEYLEGTVLKPYRLPEAALLGSLKRGKKEKKSVLKAASARHNGAMLVKPGNRPRGRPRHARSWKSHLYRTRALKLAGLLTAAPDAKKPGNIRYQL